MLTVAGHPYQPVEPGRDHQRHRASRQIECGARSALCPYKGFEAAPEGEHALRLRQGDPDLLREIDDPASLSAGDLVFLSDNRDWPGPSWTSLATYPPVPPAPLARLRGRTASAPGQTLWRVGE